MKRRALKISNTDDTDRLDAFFNAEKNVFREGEKEIAHTRKKKK